MPTLQRHQISFGKDFQAKVDLVEVVPLEIEQVILNLVNNAVDSMKEKTLDAASKNLPKKNNALWIKTYNDANQTLVTIEVQDTGMGISDDNLKRIFKPFFTTKSLGEGHGLGLSICHQFIRSYGGDIVVESQVGLGTKIKVQIPVKGMS